MNISLEDLRCFVAVAENGHLTDTAAELGLPQPTLSRRIARVEKELGATLFDRIGRTMQLNTRGAAYLQAARRMLAESEAGTTQVHRLMDPERGTVRLGFMHSLGTWLVPALLRQYRARHPHVQFELRQGDALKLCTAVREDALDLALVAPAPEQPGLGWQVLRSQQLALAVPDDHPLAAQPSVPLAGAQDEPFVGMYPGYGIQILLDRLAAQAGFSPAIAFQTMEMTTVAGLVAAGLGVALLPLGDPVLELEGLTLVPLEPAEYREIGLVWRDIANLADAPPVEKFRQFAAGF